MENSNPASDVIQAAYQAIPIEAIKPSRHQARRQFDENSIKNLSESMRQEGQLQAITVRKIGQEYELIGGERRLRAAKLLGWKTVEAKVIQTVSEGEAAAKGLIENLQRKDLNPIEEAYGFQELNQLDPAYWTHERISEIAGKSRSYVTESLSLLNLPEAIQDNVCRQTLSRSIGIEIARLPNQKAQLKAAKKIEGLNRGQARKVLLALKGKPPSSKATALKGESDPLASLWSHLYQDSALPPGSWQAKYEGSFSWSFKTSARRVDLADGASGLQMALGQWFTAMASALLAGRPQPAAAPVPAQPVEILNFSSLRAPKTDTEWAECLDAARKSPADFYRWLGNPLAKDVEGATWQDLGDTDPEAGARRLLKELFPRDGRQI